MKVPDSFFGEITPTRFLAEYWQKKPLLVRGAWPGFEPPFSVDEFRNLSMREDALARLIVRRSGSDWKLEEGPFTARDFSRLPEDKWTLLIQEVDRLVPAVHDMLGVVPFLPNWRLDDIMVSYAMPGGGVGAHIDNYDVFLLQGLGHRRWQIETMPVGEEELLEDVEVSILANFDPDEDWVLNPGDMLYLPPRIPHKGEALDPCMTFSLGCRAPSAQELIGGFLEKVMVEIDPDDRFSDPDRSLPRGEDNELGGEIIEYVRHRLLAILENDDLMKETLGSLMTEPRRYAGEAEVDEVSEAQLLKALARGARLRPVSASRGLYGRSTDGEVMLFVGGEGYRLDSEQETLARALVSRAGLREADLGSSPDPGMVHFLVDLLEQGLIKLVQ